MDRKLTRENVAEIRALASRGIPHANIARMYLIAPSTVSRVVSGESRTHCDDVPAPDLPPEAIPATQPVQSTKATPRVPRLYGGY